MRRRTKVNMMVKEIIAEDEISLEASLRPLWKFSWYTGLLFDWCRAMPNQSRLSIIARYMTIALFALIFFILLFAFFLQLGFAFWNMNSIHEVVPNFTWLNPIISSIITMIDFIIRRNEYLAFFADWALLENQLDFTRISKDTRRKIKLYTKLFCFIYFWSALFYVFIGIYLFIFRATYTDSDIVGKRRLFLQDYKILRELVPFPSLGLIQLVAYVTAMFYIALADIVSAFTFNQGGIIADLLGDELSSLGTISSKTDSTVDYENRLRVHSLSTYPTTGKVAEAIHRIWFRYEQLRILVNRANSFFGPAMIFNHGFMVFMCCTELYAILRHFKLVWSDFQQAFYGISLLFFVFRFVWTILWMSKLSKSTCSLSNSAVSLQVSETILMKTIFHSFTCSLIIYSFFHVSNQTEVSDVVSP